MRDKFFHLIIANIFILLIVSLYCDYRIITGLEVPVFANIITIHMLFEAAMAGLLPVAAFFSKTDITKKEESIIYMGVLGDWMLNYVYYGGFTFTTALAIFTAMFLGAFMFSKTVIHVIRNMGRQIT